MKHWLASASALLCIVASAAGEESSYSSYWPAWRGPHGNGKSAEKNLPTTWSPTQNVRWKVDLPERGNSTPIVWKDRIFLTQALDGGKRRALVGYDRRDGKKLWQVEVPCATSETTHPDNPPCSSSPTTDGKAVYAYFASAGVLACDLQGKQLWHRDLGKILSKHGNGGSPILYRDFLIVFHGPGEPETFLTALDKRTGETAWQTPEASINSPIFGSWGTPLVVKSNRGDELIMPLPGDRVGGPGMFKGYDPMTGKERWRCDGLGNEVYTTAAVSPKGDIVVGISGHNGPTLAVRPGGSGNVTATHRLWHQAGKNPQRIGNAIIHDGYVFIANADGFAECLDAKTGKQVWKQRLGVKLWGSFFLADGKLYVSNLEGKTFVLAARPRFELIATNDIGEPTYAALAAAGGELYLRTWKHLYCLAKTTP